MSHTLEKCCVLKQSGLPLSRSWYDAGPLTKTFSNDTFKYMLLFESTDINTLITPGRGHIKNKKIHIKKKINETLDPHYLKHRAYAFKLRHCIFNDNC